MRLISLQEKAEMQFVSSYTKKSIDLFSAYYTEYFGTSYQPLDVAIECDGSIIGLVQCCKINGSLSLPNDGLIITFYSDEYYNNKKLISHLVESLCDLAQDNGCHEICFQDQFINNGLSILGECLLNAKFSHKQAFAMTIKLMNFSAEKYKAGIRKSYKSLINWGSNNLDIQRVNKESGDFSLLEQFMEFHIKISGRQTRSAASWKLQYDMAKAGGGEMTLAYLDEKLVAASFFADYVNKTYYFTGVYERELFEHGLSHYMVYDGICQSAARGNSKILTLGYFDTHETDSKAYNIQFFKKGFSESLEPVIFWTKRLK
jgi:hypothetical protein